nr:MAG TPA_asm: regulatory protein [Caudoviricetes sp.]
MVENTISQATPVVKNTDDIRFLSIGSMPAVLSTDVARHFQKRHADVLRELDRLHSILPKSFRERNFALTFRIVPGPNGTSRKVKAYLLTRDALSLLVMGFTGKAAIMWKLRYIEAFNAMEQALYESIRREARADGKEAIHAACEKTRQETAQLFWRLGPVQKRRVRQAVRYHAMGLGKHSIAKLLDVDGREVSRLLKAAQALGWLGEKASERPALPVQGNLLALTGRREVCHG